MTESRSNPQKVKVFNSKLIHVLTHIQHFWQSCAVKGSVHIIHSTQLQYVGIVSVKAQCLDVLLLKKQKEKIKDTWNGNHNKLNTVQSNNYLKPVIF